MIGRTGENLLVGLFALGVVPFVAMRIVRGVREGRVPVYRTYLTREENRAKFNTILALHTVSLLLAALIAADLLLGLGLRERL